MVAISGEGTQWCRAVRVISAAPGCTGITNGATLTAQGHAILRRVAVERARTHPAPPTPAGQEQGLLQLFARRVMAPSYPPEPLIFCSMQVKSKGSVGTISYHALIAPCSALDLLFPRPSPTPAGQEQGLLRLAQGAHQGRQGGQGGNRGQGRGGQCGAVINATCCLVSGSLLAPSSLALLLDEG